MNYRHAYHAGNHADVMKHAALALILAHLARKETPFRVVDTHAGIGVYDLDGEAARRTGEWRDGVGRVLDARLDAPAEAALAPYRAAIRAARERHRPSAYPGSPEIARGAMRAGDRLLLVEKHPEDARLLAGLYRRDPRVKVVELDGWTALPAFVPPKERRGLVLVDPPFEARAEFERLAGGCLRAHRKWPTGIYALWFPLKDAAAADGLAATMAAAGVAGLRLELQVEAPSPAGRLAGGGLIVVNPPWTLAADMRALLPALAGLLARGPGAGWRSEPLGPATPDA